VIILYYTTSKGKNPISDFLDSLTPQQQTKILRVIFAIKEYGIEAAIPHVKKILNLPLWEIRILGKDNIRVFYVVPYKNTVLVLHGFIKKTQKTPNKEIKIALSRYREWSQRNPLDK